MRIAEINVLHYGSTGKIMLSIAESARDAGHEVMTFSPYVFYLKRIMDAPIIEGHSYFGFRRENMLHIIANRLFCINGGLSWFGTKQLLGKLKKLNPDIIHLHNLHNQTVCIPMLLKYAKKKEIKLILTLHDCWTMTGRCPHFVMAKCDKWKYGCGKCPQINEYPRSYLDLTGLMWKIKKRWFTLAANMVLVAPSKWLVSLLKESYLRNLPVKIINNGIDLSIFKPTTNDFRNRYSCKAKRIVLGVALGWGKRKGFDVFIELSKRLPSDYCIVLVGTNEALDAQLPENIISIHRTQNQTELAEIYSAADVFVNPTREDTFPTVNIEALACGTPVVTFDTGGSPEIPDETCGMVVPCDDVDAMERAIRYVCEEKPFSEEACVKRAGCFDKREKFQEYVELYEQIMK